MGFSTLAGVVTAFANGQGQHLNFQKTWAAATSANLIPQTGWTATGMPGAGGYPTVGAANGAVCTSSTVGAFLLNNSISGGTLHLTNFGAAPTVASGTGVLYLFDRIAHVQLAHNASGSITGMDATSRLAASGAIDSGAQILMEATVANTTGNTISLSYTNQSGTSGQSTPNLVFFSGFGVGRSPFANPTLHIPLANGDSGVRSIESVTLQSGTDTTGQYAIILARPLAQLTVITQNQYQERDMASQVLNLCKIYDNSCLYLVYLPIAVSTTPSFTGEVLLASA